MSSSPLPWIILGTGALGLGAVLVLRHRTPAALPAGPLTPAVQAKVADTVATATSPTLLATLAAGLQKAGATELATAALQKAANITGTPMQIPGIRPVSPGESVSLPTTAAAASGGLTSYKVASGDIPGAIAGRFGVPLNVLAGANGTNKARIMGGAIRAGETLKLPPSAVDSGPRKRATGTAA